MVENFIEITDKWGTDWVLSLEAFWHLWDSSISSRTIVIYRLDNISSFF